MDMNPWIVTDPGIARIHLTAAYMRMTRRSLKYEPAGMAELTSAIIAKKLSPAGYIKTVAMERFNRLSARDVYSLKYLPVYISSTIHSSPVIRLRIESTLSSFEFAQKLEGLESLLSKPRHDMCNIIRWCLVRQYDIDTEDSYSLLDEASFAMAVEPWFYDHLDLLPSLVDLPLWPVRPEDIPKHASLPKTISLPQRRLDDK